MSRNYNSRRYDYGEKMYQSDYSSAPVALDDENEVTVEEEAVVEPRFEEVKVEEPKAVGVSGKVAKLANMRKDPSMDSDVLCVLAAGTKITIYDNPGDFYRIENGDHLGGYMKKELCVKL